MCECVLHCPIRSSSVLSPQLHKTVIFFKLIHISANVSPLKESEQTDRGTSICFVFSLTERFKHNSGLKSIFKSSNIMLHRACPLLSLYICLPHLLFLCLFKPLSRQPICLTYPRMLSPGAGRGWSRVRVRSSSMTAPSMFLNLTCCFYL